LSSTSFIFCFKEKYCWWNKMLFHSNFILLHLTIVHGALLVESHLHKKSVKINHLQMKLCIFN